MKKSDRLVVETQAANKTEESESRQLVTSYFSASPWNRHFYYNIMHSLQNIRTIAL